MIENHGYFFQDACRVKKLIETVNHPNFGWLMDMGNFMCADENSAIALGNALPYAAHVHAKDFLFKSGDGAVCHWNGQTLQSPEPLWQLDDFLKKFLE